MTGVGSFSRDGWTLFVQGLHSYGSDRQGWTGVEDAIRKHFSEFGEIEYIRLLSDKAVGFVRFFNRSAAEFVREAMMGQSLDDDEVLFIRWATDEQNPKIKQAEERRRLDRAIEAAIVREMALQQQQVAQDVALQHQLAGFSQMTSQSMEQQVNWSDPSVAAYYAAYYHQSSDAPSVKRQKLDLDSTATNDEPSNADEARRQWEQWWRLYYSQLQSTQHGASTVSTDEDPVLAYFHESVAASGSETSSNSSASSSNSGSDSPSESAKKSPSPSASDS